MIDNTADATARRVVISLPDMFKGFLVREPVVNRHYEDVRPESEEWLRRLVGSPEGYTWRTHTNDLHFAIVSWVSHRSSTGESTCATSHTSAPSWCLTAPETS